MAAANLDQGIFFAAQNTERGKFAEEDAIGGEKDFYVLVRMDVEIFAVFGGDDYSAELIYGADHTSCLHGDYLLGTRQRTRRARVSGNVPKWAEQKENAAVCTK